MCDLGYTQWGSRETITRYGVGKKAFAVAAKQNALSPALGAMQSFPCWHTKELNWRKLWRAPDKKKLNDVMKSREVNKTKESKNFCIN